MSCIVMYPFVTGPEAELPMAWPISSSVRILSLALRKYLVPSAQSRHTDLLLVADTGTKHLNIYFSLISNQT